MKRLILLSAFFALIATPNAYAGTGDKESGPYVGIDAGYAYVNADAQDTADGLASILGGSVTVTQDTSAFIGRVYAGYNINKNFGFEVGYLKTSDVETTASGIAGNGVAYRGNADLSVSGFDYALLIKPIETRGLDGLFAKVGGHYSETSYDWSLTGTSTVSGETDEDGSGFLVGIGYEAPLANGLDARVTYTYYDNISGVSDNNSSVITFGVLAKF